MPFALELFGILWEVWCQWQNPAFGAVPLCPHGISGMKAIKSSGSGTLVGI